MNRLQVEIGKGEISAKVCDSKSLMSPQKVGEHKNAHQMAIFLLTWSTEITWPK